MSPEVEEVGHFNSHSSYLSTPATEVDRTEDGEVNPLTFNKLSSNSCRPNAVFALVWSCVILFCYGRGLQRFETVAIGTRFYDDIVTMDFKFKRCNARLRVLAPQTRIRYRARVVNDSTDTISTGLVPAIRRQLWHATTT